MIDIIDLKERLRRGFGGMVPPVCDEAANRIEELERKLHDKDTALKESRQLYADAKERIKYLESITHKQGTSSDYFNLR